VEGDSTQIQQIIMNLIINASEAIGDEPGTIWAATGMRECDDEFLAQSRLDEKPPAGTYVYVQVTDTGCGMDDATVSKVFEPFFTTKFVGRGLGMSAVLGIVRAHHGAITVQSRPGEGSTFRVLFPTSRHKKKERVQDSASEPETAGHLSGTLLIIDDEEDLRGLIGRALESRGLTIIEARDGHEGVELYQDRVDDVVCVLLDQTMPQMDGVETFHELQRIHPEVKVILMSGYSQEEIAPRFVDETPAAFIRKPFTLETLTGALAAVIGVHT